MQQYVSLPQKYQSLIRENIPYSENGHLKIFWESTESHDLDYKNGQFLKEKVPLELEEKGFFCLGCEPGSGPEPFIVVYIDNKSETIGLIKPYIYIIDKTEDHVELKVGGDMSNYNRKNFNKDILHHVQVSSDKYKVHYYNQKDIVGNRYLAPCVGCFGTHDLPDSNGKYRIGEIFGHEFIS